MKKASDILRKMSIDMRDVMERTDTDFLLDEIPRIIRTRTRLGKGVDTGGELKRLDPLSPDYKKARSRAFNLADETTPNRSNLTATGLMLEDIQGKKRGTTYSFSFKNNPRPGLNGANAPSSAKIAGYVTEQGRRFFDLSRSERKGLQRKLSAAIRRTVRQITKQFDN